MKKILSASVCAIAMAAAVPAFAADDAKPVHHKHHMMKGSHKMRDSHMMGPHTKMKPKGDPTTEDLNAKSLDAARGGATPDAGPAGAPGGAPAGAMSGPSAAPMTPPASGSTGTTTPSNTPGGQ